MADEIVRIMAESKDKVNILLVDDQPENLIALSAILEDLGENLVMASSGQDALRQLLRTDFAVILLDVQMPILDGFETAKLIRARTRTASTPIIFLTAKYTEHAYADMGYSLGAVDYLLKPFVPAVLKSKTSVFVDLYRKAEQIRRQSDLIRRVEQKEYEARLAETKERMQLELLKKELEQKELKNERKQLREASRLKSEFLANMSHEIRTPMSAVIGVSELLLHTHLTSEQKEFATVIRDSAQALLAIINDILDLSKIEAGKLELEKVDFELGPLVEGVGDLVADAAKQKGVGLITFVSPRLPRVFRGDSVRIRQTILNLMSNAVKFTNDGEISVRVELVKEGEKPNTLLVRFEVKDTGIGLTFDERKNLFQPFNQADGSTTRRYGGTGLGLSICKRLVELMGGMIGLSSKKGQGSTFFFELPMEIGNEENLPTLTQPSLDGLRALVVDDQDAFGQILKVYLGAWGIECHTTRSATEALEIMRNKAEERNPFHFATIDLIMPEMDGFALAETIKADPLLKDTKLICLTGFDAKGRGEVAVSSDFSAYLTKPVKQMRLLECISKVMSPGREVEAPVEESGLLSDENTEITDQKLASCGSILIVDDNPVNQRVTLWQLEKLGLSACSVSSGQEALEEIATGDYALIFMDCHMPVMDGFDTTMRIRDAETLTGKHIVIIGLTAQAMVGDRERCITAGMDDYISKPATLKQLDAKMRRWLNITGDAPTALDEMSSSDGFNLEDLKIQFGGEDITDLIMVFCDSTASLIERLKLAITETNKNALGESAHELKGSCATIGVMGMADTCRILEQSAKEDEVDWDNMSALVDKLDVHFAQVSNSILLDASRTDFKI